MKLNFFETWPPAKWTRVISIPIIIVFIFYFIWLYDIFNQTQYPVHQFAAQLTFSGPELKSHFIELSDLDPYRVAHYLDFIFIVIYSLLCVPVIWLARKLNGKCRRLGFVVALFFPMAGVMDIVENHFLLLMLSEPARFADWLAIAYSSFAAIKLLLFFSGLIWLISACFYKIYKVIRQKRLEIKHGV